MDMNRWTGFIICALIGLGLLGVGLLVPAHLRAVDGVVLKRAGAGTPSLVAAGLALVRSNELGAAQLYLAAARDARLTDSDQLSEAVEELASRHPALRKTGADASGPLGDLLLLGRSSPASVGATTPQVEAFTAFIIRTDNRTRALALLQGSSDPLVQSLLYLRTLTNTVVFAPSSSAAGQAFDAAIATAGLLVESGHVSLGLSKAMVLLVTEASRTGNTLPLEQVLMDLLSLGQRFNWGQLAQIVAPINDAKTLRVLSQLVQQGRGVPVIYSAVGLTGNAAGVARYLSQFGETGLGDLRLSLIYGAGGVQELLERRQQLCNSRVCARTAGLTSPGRPLAFVTNQAWRSPGATLAVKWLLYLLGGFLVAAAFHFVRRVTLLEQPLEVRGFHVLREILFALGFLAVVLLLSEPFLSQGSQKVEFPFHLHLPMVGGPGPAGSPGAQPMKFMNQVTFLTMLLFFVLQALLYVASLVKLAEIRRQRVSSRMKLKLLENEDHLFDAGLYLGFLGTIISLILVSLGLFKQPSLMAAYSSTSFGILFVVLFKVAHLRRARRHLLLQAETESALNLGGSPESPLTAPL